MNNNLTKIVTLIPSATEIVVFLGQKNSIVGRSHECDYPKATISKITLAIESFKIGYFFFSSFNNHTEKK